MRLLLELKSLKTVYQNELNNSKFYTGMHGWIYRKLKNTDFSDIHKSKEFKPFCFSNLYKIIEKKINEGDVYKVIISSINEFLIISLISNLQQAIFDGKTKISQGEQINLGEYSFELISYKPFPPLRINNFCLIESETLINLTKHENNRVIALTLEKNDREFKKQLAKNLIKKYNQFSTKKFDEDFNLWENIEIKQISSEKAVKINFIKNSDNWFDIIGARYQFKIGKINDNQRSILQLCYDLGFGERNTFGFGFMNIKKKGGEDDRSI